MGQRRFSGSWADPSPTWRRAADLDPASPGWFAGRFESTPLSSTDAAQNPRLRGSAPRRPRHQLGGLRALHAIGGPGGPLVWRSSVVMVVHRGDDNASLVAGRPGSGSMPPPTSRPSEVRFSMASRSAHRRPSSNPVSRRRLSGCRTAAGLAPACRSPYGGHATDQPHLAAHRELLVARTR